MGYGLILNKVGGLAAPLSADLKTTYTDILVTIWKSSKAQEIFSFLNSSTEYVGILVVDSSAGTDSMHIAPSVLSAEEATKMYTGGVAVLNIDSPMTIKGTKIPLGVSLMHELGHAKQYIERPEWYENLFAEILRLNKVSKDTAKIESKAEDSPSVKGVKFAKFSDKGKAIALVVDNYLRGPKRTLENDNLARHEKPVLLEIGLPFRDDYFE